MKIKTIGKYALIVGATLVLAACSTTGKKKGGPGGAADGAGAYSSGIGSENSFGGEGGIGGSNTRAPSTQTYYFEYDSHNVNDQDFASIDAQGNYLASHGGAQLVLNGYTDERGSREYNIALGERRAQSVARRLMADGAKRSQVRIVSYGSEKPQVIGHSEEAYAKNRRVHLIYEGVG